MARPWIWLQLVIGWLPVWVLYMLLILTAHEHAQPHVAAFVALRAIGAAALLGWIVYRLTERFPWPHPFQARFVVLHLLGAGLFAASWMALTSLMESAMRGKLAIVTAPAGVIPYLILGVWLYGMVTGVAYAARAAQRTARAEAVAVSSQLAALRAQLNPHFLFNALHTVVQLIPREPKRASEAAEQLAELLRTSIEESRDLISIGEEWNLVERYLAIERIRFADRLQVGANLPVDLVDALIPSFSLQTLVENAVRHGAAPKVDTTVITVTVEKNAGIVTITVVDDGVGADANAIPSSAGTGLRRLRDRLDVLYGSEAKLRWETRPEHGFTVSLQVPFRIDEPG